MIIQEANRLAFVKEYYFSKKLREVRGMIADGKPIINLGIGNPDMMPTDKTLEVLSYSAAHPDNHGYQPYKGLPTLQEAIARFYKDYYEVNLNAATEILPLIGSKEGINHISQAFLNEGDLVLVPNPGYPSYVSASKLAGAETVLYDLKEEDNWLPDFENISTEILEKTKIWWINYPNMPTGAAGDLKVLEKILKLADQHKILVVNDNPYSLILNNQKPLSIHQIKESENVALELNSLSKSHNMAGWRVGFLTGREDYINTVLKVKSNIDSGMFKPVQEAAIEALKNSKEWHKERNEVYKKRQQLAFKIMDILNCSYSKNTVGMFVWGKIPSQYQNVEDLTEKLLHEAHVFITPGFIFGSNGERFIRISLCSKNEALEESISRIKKLMS